MSEYKGMRWFKCDFQIQTPEFSADWLDADLKLKEPRRPLSDGKPDESDIQEKARAFLRRCHELELDVIGITDHNFSSKPDPRDWFLTHLIEQNKTVAKTFNRAPLIIFPGFEVDIGYHVLCLFAPKTKSNQLTQISETLTTLGLPPPGRFKNSKPTQLRREDKTVSLKTLLHIVQDEQKGIVIAAHAFSDDGICNDSKHIDDYKNEDLLCVEIPDFPLAAKVTNILTGSDSNWARPRRQPAYIMSSDAKSIAQHTTPKPNTLGYRHSWIKMSSPTIESLRQAFLDSASRISLPRRGQPDRRPDLNHIYPRIVGINISNLRFLSDQAIKLSHNLNCIIGGRGSGKSTLLECIRLGLGATKVDGDVAKKLSRIRRTFTQETEICVEWQSSPGVIDTLTFKPAPNPDQDKWNWDDRADDQVKTFLRQLPIQFFSQGELTDIASDEGSKANRLLPLVDASHSVELLSLEGKAAVAASDVQKFYAASDQRKQIANDIEQLRLEAEELERQWNARREIQKEADAHRVAQRTEKLLTDIKNEVGMTTDKADLFINDLKNEEEIDLPIPEGAQDKEWLQNLLDDYTNWRTSFVEELERLVEAYETKANAITTLREGWREKELQLKNIQKEFFDSCAERGLLPQDVSKLQELDRLKGLKAKEIAQKEKQLAGKNAEIKSLSNSITGLSELWLKQYQLRAQTVARLNDEISPTVVVSLQYMGDQAHFQELWMKLSPDKRTRLGKIWEEMGSAVFLAHASYRQPIAIWDWLRDWIKGSTAAGLESFENYKNDIIEHITGPMRSAWRSASSTRVSDFIDVTLNRHASERIGSIRSGELSEGQRNTAILTLLLAQSSGPMIIDQPEDEVDSNFLYEDLVPVLRKIKNERQLIFVTHNANIPVNADAELIFALEAKSGQGIARTQGGLDVDSVTSAVLDVMEGTDEAFRRRSEKYHF